MKYVRRYNHRKEMLKWKRFKKKYPEGFVKLKAEWTFEDNHIKDEQLYANVSQIMSILAENGGNQ